MDRSRSYSRTRSTSEAPGHRSPSRGRPRSFHPDSQRSLSQSRSRSRSLSRGPNPHQHHHHHHNKHHHQHKEPYVEEHHGLFKTSASLLAGIGLATFLAHKHWPKGILHGDEEDWASKPAPKHHREHRSSEDHRRSSRDNNAELMVQRAKTMRGRGNVVYYEEVIPVRKGEGRRRDLEARGFERRSSVQEERRSNPRLPYPEHAYPDERFYEPSSGRGRQAEAVYR